MARLEGPSKGCKMSAAAAAVADCCATREKSGRSEPDGCWPLQLLFEGAPWPAKQVRRPARENHFAVVLPETESEYKLLRLLLIWPSRRD